MVADYFIRDWLKTTSDERRGHLHQVASWIIQGGKNTCHILFIFESFTMLIFDLVSFIIHSVFLLTPVSVVYSVDSPVDQFIPTQIQLFQVWGVWCQSWSQSSTAFFCYTAVIKPVESRKRGNLGFLEYKYLMNSSFGGWHHFVYAVLAYI